MYLEAQRKKSQFQMEQEISIAWLNAKLHRAKRMPTLNKLLRFSDKPKVISSEEAEVLRKRHEQLVSQLAPDAIAGDAELLQFIKRADRGDFESRTIPEKE